MRVEVDRDLCESNAVCVGIAPDVFDLDDEDLAVAIGDEVPADREGEVREAVSLCPKIALTLREDD
ncbi:ferredoxin [Mycobacterium sp. 236(2023)]|uniref:ferredoxin n=1 Tax=Mycobacterium sp. 236(2023) TaxID=3038163 RepID=UPI0024151F2E|nr:ferredoxin [Mycobacterium sp. 236(2023)]MDG4669137.1 ferredoxin [Mycobacterium sp. 236(2023)]